MILALTEVAMILVLLEDVTLELNLPLLSALMLMTSASQLTIALKMDSTWITTSIQLLTEQCFTTTLQNLVVEDAKTQLWVTLLTALALSVAAHPTALTNWIT